MSVVHIGLGLLMVGLILLILSPWAGPAIWVILAGCLIGIIGLILHR